MCCYNDIFLELWRLAVWFCLNYGVRSGVFCRIMALEAKFSLSLQY